ncbi:MAG: oxidoreductase [Porticoccaceae bacterium]|nr:oxidoreductase [Porticoccaceae bacterium]
MKNFAVIGAAGYIAPRHFQAIKMTKNNLAVAMDVNDSVGVIDSYFPRAEFFTEFEDFSKYIDKLTTLGQQVDYIVVCSPNFCHVKHIEFGLERGIDVICEKPLVLCSNELEALIALERSYGAKVYSILQLRLHPSIIALRQKVQNAPKNKIFDLDLTYITSRGNWYLKSWKGSDQKSGGLSTNIGVHFYDMLHHIFGDVKHNEVHFRDKRSASGYLEYERARVKWFLSINSENLPNEAIAENKMTYRSIVIGDRELEFSSGFTDLHVQSYQSILIGDGFGISENRAAIKTVERIRNQAVVNAANKAHTLLENVIRG